MPYQISWVIQQKVVRLDVQGVYTPAEIRQSCAEVRTFIEQGVAPVHVVIDMTQVTHFTQQLSDVYVPEFLQMITHDRLGNVCAITEQMMINVIIGVMSKLAPFKFRNVRRYDDAVRYIMAQDTSLRTVASRQ